MDNQDSLAYEYGRFEEKKQTPKIETVKKSKPQTRHSHAGTFRAVCCMTVMVVAISALIYTRAVQAEVASTYNATMSEYNVLKGENARLQVKLEQELSADNIEKMAREELNMQELDNTKIEYVDFNSAPKAEILKKQSWYDEILAWFNNLFY